MSCTDERINTIREHRDMKYKIFTIFWEVVRFLQRADFFIQLLGHEHFFRRLYGKHQ